MRFFRYKKCLFISWSKYFQVQGINVLNSLLWTLWVIFKEHFMNILEGNSRKLIILYLQLNFTITKKKTFFFKKRCGFLHLYSYPDFFNIKWSVYPQFSTSPGVPADNLTKASTSKFADLDPLTSIFSAELGHSILLKILFSSTKLVESGLLCLTNAVQDSKFVIGWLNST